MRTPPLPELAALRDPAGAVDVTIALALATATELPGGLRGRSVEVLAKFATLAAAADGLGWDLGLQLYWSDDDQESTRVGIRDGTVMPGIDLWDEVNGDLKNTTAASAEACRAACSRAAAGSCGAWTFTDVSPGGGEGVCRLKALAHRSLLVAEGSPGCFLPTHGGWGGARSTSGFVQQRSVRFAMLYVDRAKSWATASPCGSPANTTGDCYGHFGYAQMLRIVPSDPSLTLHAFADRSVLEVFGQGGRAAVTARVYPTIASSDRIGVFGVVAQGPEGSERPAAEVVIPTTATVAAWRLTSAVAIREEVLAR